VDLAAADLVMVMAAMVDVDVLLTALIHVIVVMIVAINIINTINTINTKSAAANAIL